MCASIAISTTSGNGGMVNVSHLVFQLSYFAIAIDFFNI
jgi:hypothetical protein